MIRQIIIKLPWINPLKPSEMIKIISQKIHFIPENILPDVHISNSQEMYTHSCMNLVRDGIANSLMEE